KPAIESMASLPSVVLGFLAAMVLAPFVDNWLAAVLAGIVTLPAAFVIGAYLWQLLPEKLSLRLARYRFLFILAVLPLGIAAAAGLDPRGTFVGTYVQRNALVVGFMMGFAIIPIIFTIADDALSSVPEHLRSASLGCGATPWQTAVRVIIPTAMSGLFSAVMIGLGRAIGETMIVLMAAGAT